LTELEVLDGDITALEVDAIGNAANNRLWMGGGVAGAIKRAGGEEIEREAVQQGPIEVGEAAATSAGRLPARWVVHGAVMGQDLQTNAELVGRTTESCLRLADELGAESLALPAFGTGVGGFPLDEAARIEVGEVRRHLDAGSQLQRVVFAVHGEPARAAFQAAVDA
jgi:O-acetyl-ADP-ribose deacetylase (regulator of RNase III)